MQPQIIGISGSPIKNSNTDRLIQGNLPCVSCIKGDECETSGMQKFFGPDAKTSEIGYARVEGQEMVWAEAAGIGRQIGERLQ